MAVFMKRERFSQVPLPYEKLGYIQSTGTQYIDTGVLPNNNTCIIINAYNDSTSSVWMYGAWNSNGNSMFAYATNMGFYYGSENQSAVNDNIGVLNVEQNKTNYISNAISGSLSEQSFECNYNMFLFCLNAGGTRSSGTFRGKIYSCKIYDNDILIRDYIPVKMKESGEVGLWDKVNRVFYGNAGTGSFVGVRFNCALEYIQSSGTQYINTEYYPKYNTRLVMETSDITTSQGFVFGTRDTNSGTSPAQYNLYRESSTSLRSDYFGTAKGLAISDTTAKTTIDKNANITTCFGSTITNTAVTKGQCSYPLFLFALNNVGSPLLYGYYKLYSCKIYEGDVLVRDYIPYWNQYGEIGLKDKVQNKFYPNAGTGTFVSGGVAA